MDEIYTYILGAIVLLLVILSIRQRVINSRCLARGNVSESKVSPFSSALASLVGTAGGIYLSVVMLTTFLEMDIPAKVQLWQFNLEPLAAVSFVIAILQPFFLRLIKR